MVELRAHAADRRAGRRDRRGQETLTAKVKVAARDEPDAGHARLPSGHPVARDLRDAGAGHHRGRAATSSTSRASTPHVEIMIPLVGFARGAQAHARLTVDTAEKTMASARSEHRLQDRHHDRAPAGRADRRPDRRVGRLLQLRHQRPHPDDAGLLPRRRRGQVPHLLPAAGRSSPDNPFEKLDQVGRGPAHRHGRAEGPLGQAGTQDGHLRRARRRAEQRQVLPPGRPGLRQLQPVPGPAGPAGGRAGGARGEDRRPR